MRTKTLIESTPNVGSRRGLNTRTAVASPGPQQRYEQTSEKNAIRPFRVKVPEAELTELRRRINATKWPAQETVTGAPTLR